MVNCPSNRDRQPRSTDAANAIRDSNHLATTIPTVNHRSVLPATRLLNSELGLRPTAAKSVPPVSTLLEDLLHNV